MFASSPYRVIAVRGVPPLSFVYHIFSHILTRAQGCSSESAPAGGIVSDDCEEEEKEGAEDISIFGILRTKRNKVRLHFTVIN